MGAGFNNPTAGYFWYMCEHDGWLYLGTYDVTSWLPYVRPEIWPIRIRRYVEQFGIENILSIWAGFDLWRSRDGVRWFSVNRNGFGNPCNYGVRTMASSPFGLFIGAANPFAPTMAVRKLAGWKYVPNARGGLEIWLGTRQWDENETEAQAVRQSHPTPKLEKEPEDPADLHERLIEAYYEGSGFRHCGLWRNRTKSPVQACEDLVEEMLSFLPDGQKRILEIGCGRGATTRTILHFLPETSLTAVVKAKKELDECRRKVPEATCRRMKGPRLKFKCSSFDAVISVEGLKEFGKPSKLFREIYRVLKHRGTLVFSDIILDLSASPKNKSLAASNIANSPEEIKQLLLRMGFQHVQIHNTTQFCWRRFQQDACRKLKLNLLSEGLSQDYYPQLLAQLPNRNLPVSHYIICSASKEDGKQEIGVNGGTDDKHNL
jgi:SAM-dependent methyltransferase